MSPRAANLLLFLAAFPSSCAATNRAAAPDPREEMLSRSHDETEWLKRRRGQLDLLFDHVAVAEQADDALEWLRVYLLTQVADEKDRDARSIEMGRFNDRLAALDAASARADGAFGKQLESLLAEVRGMRQLLGLGAVAETR